MIPPASRETIEEALRRFDRELRTSADWQSWEKNGAFKYAIEADGHRYPVKQIIAMATGASKRTFSGGPEANSYLTSRGFRVVPIREGEQEVIQKGLEKILTRYAEVRQTKPFGQDPDLWPAFNSVCDGLRSLSSIASRPTLEVVWSAGRGNWARVPWISLLDKRETSSTQQGVYCVFLFREDLSGVYLTFNQGVTEPKKRLGPAQGLDEVKQRAVELRASCGSLAEAGYHLDGNIDLRAEGGLGSEYESSTIAYKLYEKGKVPPDEDIADDVDELIEVYERYLVPDKEKGVTAVAKPAIAPEQNPRRWESSAQQTALDELTRFLAEEGLHFSEELIANYLLALRTKRLVILSGLSGTGKTQLALAVAKFFEAQASSPQIVDLPEDAVVLEARPYMFQHNQLTLPRALLDQMKLAAPREGTKGGGQLNVLYPKGRERLAFWRNPDLSNNSLFLRGAFRDWFKSTLKAGDKLLVRAVSKDQNEPDELEITLPQTRELSLPLQNRCVLAVRPDWTDSRGLLGYFNPLTKSYVVETSLELLLRADKETRRAAEEHRPPNPFFLILDEMNLAHVEQYFSDFLSCLESGEPITLHREIAIESGANEEEIAVPRDLQIPGNLYFTGTVNVDETTYMFSPKVLDRAFTIELHNVDLENYGRAPQQQNPEKGLKLTTMPMLGAPRKPDITDWKAFEDLASGRLRTSVTALNNLLAPFNLHFGYRVANEIGCFVTLAARHTDGQESTLWSALDLAILEKVLPKLHGTQEELDEPLRILFGFALTGTANFKLATWQEIREGWKLENNSVVQGDGDKMAQLPRTATKVWLMLQTLHRQGFASFIA